MKKKIISFVMAFVMVLTIALSGIGSITTEAASLLGDATQNEVVDAADLIRVKWAEYNYEKSNARYSKTNDVLYDAKIDTLDVDKMHRILLEIDDEMVVISSWAYGAGSIDNTKTYGTAGYEYATVITGSNSTYAGALMMDADLSAYDSFRFAVKSSGSYWEVGFVANSNFSLFSGNATDWVEYEFKNEGNGYFQGYRNGSWFNVQIPLDANLSDLQMKFGTSGTLYLTEVRGIMKSDTMVPLKIVADSFNTKSGTTVSGERPNLAATKSTEAATSWEATERSLTDVDLSLYNKVIFYARKTSSGNANAWFESTLLGSFVVGESWTEFKLVKNSDDTWNLYSGGKLRASNKSLTNLSDITAKYGTDSYYFSQVFGVSEEMEETVIREEMVVASPWAYGSGTLDNTKTYGTAGYEYATVITGSNSTYAGALMMDADLSAYDSFRFAVKSSGSYWEVGFVANSNFSLFSGNATDWVEYEFKNEGSGYFQGYRNGSWFNVQIPLDANLSDLQMKFGTSGTLYLTEVRGTLSEGAARTLEIVADNFNSYTGERKESETPNYLSDGSIYATTTWSSTKVAMTSVDLTGYEKVIFYARKTSGTGYFESTDFGTAQLGDSWTEYKLVKNDDGTWNLYRAGTLITENKTMSNLNEVLATYGTASYYFSQVFAVPDTSYIELVDEASTALYSVAYSSSDEFASQEFVNYMKETTGAEFTATCVTSIPDSEEKTIVLGNTLASQANMDYSELETDYGYAIQQSGNNIYVYGNTTQGTLNGVYALLNAAVGLEIYTNDCYTATYTEGGVAVDNISTVYNPTIDYLFDFNGETRANEEYRKKLGYILDYSVIGGNIHSEGIFATAEKADGTSYYTGELTNGHITLNETYAGEVAQWMYDKYIVDTYWLDSFYFGLSDDSNWYSDTEVGQARTNEYVTFMNHVAQKLQDLMDTNGNARTVSIAMLAYAHTIKAPSVDLVSQTNVKLQIVYAPSTANWYKPLTHEVNDNATIRDNTGTEVLFTYDADEEFREWVEKAGKGNVLFWTYHTFFDNYLTPFDCLDAMQKNFALAAELGVKGVFDNVQYDNSVATDWNRLKVYLRSALAKNPTMSDDEYNQLIANFMDAYFGVASTYMQQALSAERELLSTVYDTIYADISDELPGRFSNLYGCGKAGFMINAGVQQWSYWGIERSGNALLGYSYSNVLMKDNVYAQISNAYNAVTAAVEAGTISAEEGATLTNRIKLESIAVRFILLRCPGNGDDNYVSLLADCQELGVTYIGEGKNLTYARLQSNDAE